MRIIVNTDGATEVAINTDKCEYPRQVTRAIKLALELDGFADQSIDEIFEIVPELKESSDVPIVIPEYRSFVLTENQLHDHTPGGSTTILNIMLSKTGVGPFLNSKGIKIDAITNVNGLTVFLTKDLITKII